MKQKPNQKGFRERFSHEMHQYVTYVVFFALFFSAFSTYKRLILGQEAISYMHYGYSLFESLILAKIILIGQMIGLGDRFSDKPLIYPTLYKTIVFSIFVLAFSIFEHFVMGFFNGKKMTDVYQEVLNKGINEIVGEIVVMFFVFVLFFGFLELKQALGNDKLFNLFFRKRNYK